MKPYTAWLSILFAFGLLYSGYAQVNSQSDGDWNDTNTWDCGCIPDFSNGIITVAAGNTVRIPDTYTADADEIVVAGDGVLIVEDGGRLIVRSSGGTDLTIEEADFIFTFSDGLLTVQDGGVLENRSIVSSNASNLVFESGSEYQHNRNGGAIPTANYLSGSTVRITGITNTAISGGLGQNFHHVIWECASQAGSGGFLNGNITSIGGDFTINNTNNQFLILGYTSGLSTGSTTVTGNLSINGTSKFYVSAVATYTLNVNGNLSVAGVPTGSANYPLLGTANGTIVVNVSQNVSFSSARISRLVSGSGNFTLNNTGTITISTSTLEMAGLGTGSSVINSTGAVSVTSGTINMSSTSGTGTINAFNNFTMASSTITEGSTGSGTINFVGTGTHVFSKTGGSITNDINFINASASTLDLGTSILEGTGSFTNNGTLRVGSTHASGALQATTILDSDCGNIIVSGIRTYANPSVIVYNGGSAQILGDGHPTTAGVDITIANASGVSINAPTTLAGTINLTSGNLNVGASSLTITGGVSGPNFITVGGAGSLTLAGSSNIGTFPFAAGAHSFANFTLNNTNGITFANDVTLSGALTLTNGNLNFNNRMLALNGTLSAGGGSFSGNASSILSIGGSGAFGSLPLTGTIGTLTLDRSSGTVDINGSLMVVNTFNLLNGDFTNTNGLQMVNGSLLRRKGASAQLLGNPPTNLPAGQFYNVAYSDVAGLGSGLTTGLELPNTTDDNLGSLTINSSASVVLDKNINVNGDVNLQSGTLSAVANNITMSATTGTWSKTLGTFNGGSGSVIIAGNITMSASSTPNFTNIIANSGSSLTFPSGNINIAGDLQLNSGGTFVSNGGTIILNGSGNQTITGAGRTFTNFTVNKAGGNVSLLPTVNLTGILNILSATTVQSNGNLILISTSDATSGNASIAKIPSGASITGNVSVQRFMSAETRIQREISSAVQSPQVSQIQTPVAGSGGTGITITGPFTGSSFPCTGCTTNGPSMYFYNEVPGGASSAGWTGSGYPVASNTETLQTGRGYSLLVRDGLGARTMALTGTINSGDINLPVTYNSSGSPADDGWNLVGNPYPSTIDWNNSLGWVKTAIQGNMISIWDAGLKQYKSWNGSTGSLGSGRIAQGQAFWIQANGAPTLTVSEDAKIPSTGAFYKIGDLDFLEIILAKGTLDDRAYLQRMDGASDDIDVNDGRKLPNATFSLSSLSTDGQSLTFNTSDNIMCNSTVPLKVTYDVEPANVNGSYKFSTSAVGQYQSIDVVLSDAFTNTTFDLTAGAEYDYDVTDNAASRAADRFALLLTPKAVTLNLNLSGSAEVCAGTEGLITITNAETGIGYYPELNGVRIGDTAYGAGANLDLTYPGANLENGPNSVVVKAVNLCGVSSLTQQIEVNKDELYTPVPVSGKSCLAGEVTLTATGAPGTGTYRWYAEEGAVNPLFEGASFVTPSLDKTKTYFVAAVNSLGCEGLREPIVAEVTNYDEATIEVQGNQLISNYNTGIQWYRDGEPILGETGKTLQVEESGNYTVTVSVGSCTTTSAGREMVVTGLEELSNGVTAIHPNPVTEILNIRYPGSGALSAAIFEGTGRKVASKELLEENGFRVGTFDMSTSSQGFYYLQLSDNTKIVILKFLKK